MGVGGHSIGYCESKHTITCLLSISNPNMLWSCVCVYLSLSISHFSSGGFFDLLGCNGPFEHHTPLKVDRYWNLTLQVGKLPPPSRTFFFFFFFCVGGASIGPPCPTPFDSPFCSDFTWFVCCGHMFPWELLHLECGCVWEIFHLHRT